MRFKILFFTFLIILFGFKLFSQEVKQEEKTIFSIDAEFRNKTEFSPSIYGRNLIVPEGTDASISIWQRSRIVLNYKSSKLESKFSIQDVRPFVQNTGSWESSNGAALSVHEAWVKYFLINNESRKLGLKLGRQELINPDGRLLWNRDWNEYGAAHDAISFECDNKEFDAKWSLGFSLNSTDFPGTATFAGKKYRNIGFFNFSKNFGEIFTLNITDLMESYENGGMSNAIYAKNSFGLNPVFKYEGFKFDGSFYYQHGTPSVFNGTEKFAAYLYTANVSYKLGKVSAGVGYDNYSGEAYDDDQTDGYNKAFNTFIQAGHLYFGNTDFHLRLLGKNRGLTDLNVKLNAELSKKTSLYAAMHMINFGETNVYVDAIGTDVEFKSVGTNIDFVLNQSLGSKMSVKLGYSVMLPSEDFVNYSIGNIADPKFHGWGWLMFSFKPNFFKVEN